MITYTLNHMKARDLGGGAVAIATKKTRRIFKAVQIIKANELFLWSESKTTLHMPIKDFTYSF